MGTLKCETKGETKMDGLISQVNNGVQAANDALCALSDYLLQQYPNDSGWQSLKDAVAEALAPLMDSGVLPPAPPNRR